MAREKSRRSFIEATEAGLNFKAVQRERNSRAIIALIWLMSMRIEIATAAAIWNEKKMVSMTTMANSKIANCGQQKN